MVQCPPMGGLCVKEKQEKAARWKTFGIAALLWAGLAAAFSVLFPAEAAAPAGLAGVLRNCLVLPVAEELTAKAYALGMGLIFGWAADRAGSLLPGLVLHILNNGIMLADCLAERRIP